MTVDRGAQVYLALGSNLGDRGRNLRDAVQALVRHGVRIGRVSPLYASRYVGPPPDQPEYLNAVLEARTELQPADLWRAVCAVERAAGRPSGTHGQPRLLDIDVLFYEDLHLSGPDLVLPHPRIAERLFVLEPLYDLGALDRRPELAAARAALAGRQEIRRFGPFEIGVVHGTAPA